MSQTPNRELTPLVEELLTIVAKTCKPSNQNWQSEFIDTIYLAFYCYPNEGQPITSADESKREMRLISVEKAISLKKRPTATKTISNFGN